MNGDFFSSLVFATVAHSALSAWQFPSTLLSYCVAVAYSTWFVRGLKGGGAYGRADFSGPKDSTVHALGRPAPPPAHKALIRLLLGELTSLSLVKLVFCTQEGRKNVHKGVLFFDVSHTPKVLSGDGTALKGIHMHPDAFMMHS